MLVAVVLNVRSICYAYGDFLRVDLQFAIGLCYCELSCYIVAVSILYNCGTADSVCNSYYVDAARIGCSKPAYCELVTVNCELECLESCSSMALSVVSFLGAIGHNFDLELLGPVGDGQVTRRLSCKCVVSGAVASVSLGYRKVVSVSTGVGVYQSTLCRIVCYGSCLAFNYSCEDILCHAYVLVAVVFNVRSICYAYGDGLPGYLECSVSLIDCELSSYIIAGRILYNCITADRVDQVADVDAYRIGCGQSAYCELVAVHCELKRLESGRCMALSVVSLLSAVGHYFDLELLSSVGDGQVTRCLSGERVVSGAVAAVSLSYCEVVSVSTGVGINQSSLCRIVSDGSGLALNYSIEDVLCHACVLVAVVLDVRSISYAYGNLTSCDLESSVSLCDCELCGYIISGRILYDLGSADLVGQVAYVDAARIGCGQSFNYVGISINSECERLKSGSRMACTVINISSVAVCYDFDLVLVGTILNGQLTLGLGAERVVAGHICAISINYLEGAFSVSAVIVGVNKRSLRRCVSYACSLAFNYIVESISSVTKLLRTIVFNSLISNAYSHLTSCYFQSSVSLSNCELCSYIVSCRILNDCGSANRVGQVADVDANRIGCGQSAYSVGVAANCELESLEACSSLRGSVIDVTCVAYCDYFDLILFSTILNGQLTLGLGAERVVAGHICAISINYLEGAFSVSAVIVGVNKRSLRRCVGDRSILSGYNIAECVLGITELFRTIVFNSLISNAYGYLTSGYFECSVSLCNCELCRYIISGRILNYCGSADRVGQVADVDACRIGCGQSAYSVGVAVNCELKSLESGSSLFGSVIDVSGVAVSDYLDLVLFSTILDRQFTLGLFTKRVVGRYIDIAGHYLEVVCVRTVVIGRDSGSLRSGIGNGSSLSCNNVIECVFGVTILLRSVVLNGLVSYAYGYLTSCDLQGSVSCLNCELSSYIVSVCVPNNCGSADSVSNRYYVGALWIRCGQSFNCVSIIVDSECQSLESGRGLLSSVIDVSGVAIRDDCNLVLLGTVFDDQLTLGLSSKCVVAGHVVALGVEYSKVSSVRTVVICVDERSLGSSVSDSCSLAVYNVVERVIAVTILFGSVVCYGPVFDLDGHFTSSDLECSVSCCDCELCSYIVACRILNDCCSADRVGQAADVGALRIRCSKPLNSVGVAVDCEFESLESLGFLLGAVIDVSCAAVCYYCDLILICTILDDQLALGLSSKRVVACNVVALSVNNSEVCAVSAVVIGAYQRSLGSGVSDSSGLSGYNIVECVFGVTVLLGSVVLNCLVFDAHSDLTSCDLESSVSRLDCELRGHIVFVSILNDCYSADRVGQAADVGALRIGSGKTLNSVGIAINCECESLESLGFLLGSVIDISGIAVRDYGYLILFSTIFDGQLTLGLVSQRVIARHIDSISHYLEVVRVRTVVVGVYQSSAGRCVCNCSSLAVNYVVERVFGVTILLRSVICYGSVFDLNGHFASGDLESSVCCLDSELICYNVSICVLNDCGAAYRVGQVADVGACRIRCGQSAYSVGVAIDCELKSHESGRSLFGSVIDVAGVALSDYFDLILIFAVFDHQLTLGLIGKRVVAGNVVAAAVNYLEVILVRTIVICSYQNSAGRCVSDCSFLSGYYVIECVCGVTILLRTIVLNGLVSYAHGDLTSCDLESSVSRLDCELCSYIVSVSILNDCCSADRVGQVADVGALRIRSGKTLNSVGVAVNCELESLESLCFLLGSIIDVSGVALRNDSDLVLLLTVGDRQLTLGLFTKRVVAGHIIAFSVNDCKVVCVSAVVVCVDKSSAGRCVSNSSGLSVYNVIECVCGVTILFRSVVLN